jgi:CRP-like cAMP-binding protein
MAENNRDDLFSYLKNNELFHDLTEPQLKLVVTEIEEVTVKKGDFIIRENEISDNIYIIKNGTAEITKFDAESNQDLHVAYLPTDAIVGEIAMIDREPRSATVRATTPCTLLSLSIKKLQDLNEKESILYRLIHPKKNTDAYDTPPIYSIIVHNIAKMLTQRLRTTSTTVIETLRSELSQAKMRTAMSQFIINTLALLSGYIIILQLIAIFQPQVVSSTVMSIPVMIFLLVPMLYMMWHSGYPLSTYGLTTKNWKASLIESILFSLPVLLVIVAYKAILINYSADFSTREYFDLSFDLAKNNLNATVSVWEGFGLIFLYVIFVPIQEILVRGSLQSSFKLLLTGRYTILKSILLSNLLFTVMHSHVSLLFGLAAFIPGIFWGWLYSRQHTLIGVTASHILIGIWAVFIVGII